MESQVDINTHSVAMGLEWAAQLLNKNNCYGVYTQLSLCTASSIRDSSAHWRESGVIDVTVYVCTLHIHRKVVYTIELEKLSYPILPVDSTYFSRNLCVQSKADYGYIPPIYHLLQCQIPVYMSHGWTSVHFFLQQRRACPVQGVTLLWVVMRFLPLECNQSVIVATT